jgi:hypothetical protein
VPSYLINLALFTKKCSGQTYNHKMAHTYREPLLEWYDLLPHKMTQDENRDERKALSSRQIFAKSHASLFIGQRQSGFQQDLTALF